MAIAEAPSNRRLKISRPSAGYPRLSYHFLAAVDVECFSRLDVLEQVIAQDKLRDVLERAACRAGLDRTLWQVQMSGDGEFAVLPPDIDGPQFVADYPRELETAIQEVNNGRGSGPRLRVRAALHHGIVANGQLGPAGRATIAVSRLLDSETLRQQLRCNDADFALIVSDALFRDVIQSRFRGLDPAEFAMIEEVIKGQSYVGYIREIGRSDQRTEAKAVTTAECPAGTWVDRFDIRSCSPRKVPPPGK